MAASSNNTGVINILKEATWEDKPEGYMKAFSTQQIADYQKYIEDMGPIMKIAKGQVGKLRVVMEEMRAAGEGGVALMRLQQDLSEAEVKLVDLEHWVKKAEMGIVEKRMLLGEDW